MVRALTKQASEPNEPYVHEIMNFHTSDAGRQAYTEVEKSVKNERFMR
jgi:hypothetical protein